MSDELFIVLYKKEPIKLNVLFRDAFEILEKLNPVFAAEINNDEKKLSYFKRSKSALVKRDYLYSPKRGF